MAMHELSSGLWNKLPHSSGLYVKKSRPLYSFVNSFGLHDCIDSSGLQISLLNRFRPVYTIKCSSGLQKNSHFRPVYVIDYTETFVRFIE